MNRLANETSPYLLQHAGNPVDWYPWGDEAFERARRENKPILLSVGYSACHWCHVMAHESFEDDATAELMNGLYINIKVDREERPDVDDIYMNAVQQFSGGHGGWPMTVFLLPDGRPFYGGTYYPLQPRYGMPSFQQVLAGVYDAYRNRRDQVEGAAAQVTGLLQRDRLGIGGTPSDLTADLLDAAYARMRENFDPRSGGFGGAPKFPNPMNLEFLLRTAARAGSQEALDHAMLTLVSMARGGIYDQLGGGFHRYSVDAVWLVPHFEKMLYDNAQLSRVYLHAFQQTGDPSFRTIACEIYDYVLREMTAPEGGFYSTTDADSEGEEGKFFVWSQAELQALLGDSPTGDDAAIAVEYWGVTPRGNFEGHSILFVPNDDAVAAERLNLSVEDLRARLAAIKDKLFAARTQRVPPGLDDKVLTAWNGMMLASLAEAARVLDRDDYRAAALRCAEFFDRAMRGDGSALRRTYKDGQARIEGFLEDYAGWIDGLLELYQTTFDRRWFAWARALADHALAVFRAEDGGFYDVGAGHEQLIARPRSLQDNATPSGASMFARCLIRLNAYTGVDAYAEAAQRTLALLTAALREYPQAFGEALNAVDMLVGGLAEVAVIGAPDAARALLDAARKPYRPNLITALAAADVDGDDNLIPLLSHRTARAGQPTVYVCRHFACQMPVTTPEALAALL
ncbi:MAG: thioredoxin domain-containing protein [Anaerolineae bacterium]|nr:thioredoxin domain-containing protein [Anaerolineae bacterium]NUQ05563.1 thioredoxin domain-containing protein [Anaerolineae bacterium]